MSRTQPWKPLGLGSQLQKLERGCQAQAPRGTPSLAFLQREELRSKYSHGKGPGDLTQSCPCRASRKNPDAQSTRRPLKPQSREAGSRVPGDFIPTKGGVLDSSIKTGSHDDAFVPFFL